MLLDRQVPLCMVQHEETASARFCIHLTDPVHLATCVAHLFQQHSASLHNHSLDLHSVGSPWNAAHVQP